MSAKRGTMAVYFMLGSFALSIGLFFKFVLRGEAPVRKIEYLWKKVLAKLQSYARLILPLLFFAVFLVANFDTFREVLGAALSESTVLIIRSMLYTVFGTHSVMYSLQYLCAYAFLSFGLSMTFGFAIQHALYPAYLITKLEIREDVSLSSSYSLKESAFSPSPLAVFGQLRI